MFKKSPLVQAFPNQITRENIKKTENSGLDDLRLSRLIKTPRSHSNYNHQIDELKTQKFSAAKKATISRDISDTSIKLKSYLRQNLLDLDFGYLQNTEACDSKFNEHRPNFIVRKVNTPSLSSKGKLTSTGSSVDSSEIPSGVKKDEEKNATESQCKEEKKSRRKNKSKNHLQCRIVHSKKLPFQINQRYTAKMAKQYQLDLNLSKIEKIGDANSQFISIQSYENLQNICGYL